MQDTSDQNTDDAENAGDPVAPRRRRWRKIVITFVVLAITVPLLGIGGYTLLLNRQIDNVDKIPAMADPNRPDPDNGKALNVLLLGSDKGQGDGKSKNTTMAEDARAPKWPAGKYRSDTIMVVNISADRQSVFVSSIPRDTFTTIYDAKGKPHGKQKINAAMSLYGPAGAVSTVEHLTGLRMEHLAVLDWDGFKELSTAVGGVPVHIAEDSYDSIRDVRWKAGDYNLKGERALLYVRQRYGLLGGDFDRIARQQNFLRSLMKKVLSQSMTEDPVQFFETVKVLTKNLTVDAEWSGSDIRGLAKSLDGLQTKDVRFIIAPVAGTETIPVYGSIVRLDDRRAAELFRAVRKGYVSAYLDKYPEYGLKGAKAIG